MRSLVHWYKLCAALASLSTCVYFVARECIVAYICSAAGPVTTIMYHRYIYVCTLYLH